VVTGWNVFLLQVTTGIGTPAVAQTPTPINVEFSAPAGCSSLDSFYRGVRARTDRVRLANPGEQGVQISVHVSRVGTNIRGELRIGDSQEESETRRVDGISCNEVVEALSLTAALALDPTASLLSGRDSRMLDEPLPAKAPVVPAPSASIATVSPTSQVPIPAVPERTFVRGVDVSAQALAASYMTHGLMLGPQVGVRLLMAAGRWAQISAGVQGFYVSNEMAGSAGSGIFSLAGMGLTLCPIHAPVSGWLELGACAFGRGGSLKASAPSVSHPNSARRSWWAFGTESFVGLRLYRAWRVELSAGLAVPLAIREFSTGTAAQAREVGKTPIVAAQAGVGFVFRF
jgi:hypothetical protein